MCKCNFPHKILRKKTSDVGKQMFFLLVHMKQAEQKRRLLFSTFRGTTAELELVASTPSDYPIEFSI